MLVEFLSGVVTGGVYDLIKKAAKSTLGEAPTSLVKALDRAYWRASEAFGRRYGTTFGNWQSSFLARQANVEAVLSLRFLGTQDITIEDFDLRGFDGVSEATTEAAQFFLELLVSEMRRDELLNRLLHEQLNVRTAAEVLEIVRAAEARLSGIESGLDMLGSSMAEGMGGLDAKLTWLVEHFEVASSPTELLVIGKAGGTASLLITAREALNAGRVKDGHTAALSALGALSEGGAASDRCDANWLVARALLATRDQRAAAPYLKEAASYCSEKSRRHRYLAFAALLQGELNTALEQIECAWAEGETREMLVAYANILVALGRPSDAVLAFEESGLLRDAEFYHDLAWISLAASDFEQAYEHASQALALNPDHAPALIEAAEALVLGKQYRIEQGEPQAFSEEEVESLELARIHLERALDKLDPQNERLRAKAFFRLGTVHTFLGNVGLAVSAFRSGVDLDPSDETMAWNLAFALHESDRLDEAHSILERLSTGSRYAFEAKVNLILRRLQKGQNPEETTRQTEALVSGATGDKVVRARLLLAQVYAMSLRTADAERTLREAESEYPEDATVYSAWAGHYARLKVPDKAVEMRRRALELSRGGDAHEAQLRLADTLYARGKPEDYPEAAELYAHHITAKVPSEYAERFATSLYEADRLAECLTFCEEASLTAETTRLIELRAGIYFQTDNFAEAAPLYLRLALLKPADINYLMRAGISRYRMGDLAEAADALRQAEHRAVSAVDCAVIAEAYGAAGLKSDALRMSYEAYKRGAEDPEMHLQFFRTVVHAPEGEPVFDEIGEAFRDVSERFNERFPGHKGLVKKQIDTENPEQMVEQLLSELPDRGTTHLIDHWFTRGDVPVASLAKLTHRDLITTWLYVTQGSETSLLCTSGDLKDLARDVEAVRKTSAVMVDPVALLTLHELGLLDRLTQVFEQVMIPQAFRDTILNLRGEREIRSRQKMTISRTDDGRLHVIERN